MGLAWHARLYTGPVAKLDGSVDLRIEMVKMLLQARESLRRSRESCNVNQVQLKNYLPTIFIL